MKEYTVKMCFMCGIFGLISTGVMGQTLSGYTNSFPLSSYDLNAGTAFALYEEWKGIMSPNLDDVPSARETEIYQTFIRSEKGDEPITTYTVDDSTWAAIGVAWGPDKMEFCKELAWLVPLLHRNDKFLALRGIENEICYVTGEVSDIWVAGETPGQGNLSPLGIGNTSRSPLRLANWILDHPELYPQTAPSNSVIPITVPTTYYERAKFYLEEVKFMYEICIQGGMHWEYDPSGDGHAWVWWGSSNTSNKLEIARATYPSGIPVANIRTISNDEGYPLHAYNRVFSYIASYQECAEGLQIIDAYEGTSVHSNFCETAFDFVEKTLNSFRFWRQEFTEAEPAGRSFTWPYSPDRDPLNSYEDATHFEMDINYLSGLRHLLTTNDLLGISGTVYSRHFDSETHFIFRQLNRSYQYNATTGEIESNYWWKSPGLLSWVGEGGAHGHMQGAAALSMEVFDEQMRKMAVDSDYRGTLLNRDDTRRTRYVKGPFELYDLKMKRAQRGLTPTPDGNNSPVFTHTAPIHVVNEPLGTLIGSVGAYDPDAGQTIRYWIIGGNIDNRYKIDSNTGEIRMNQQYPLLAGSTRTNNLQIAVMDDGVPMGMATATVQVVLDEIFDTPVTLTYQATINGTISGSTPQVIGYNGDGTAVTIVPKPGYFFLNWSDGSSDNPRTDLTMTNDLTVTAIYEAAIYNLIYSSGGNGSVSGATAQSLTVGLDGTAVTAIPSGGSEFLAWSDGNTDNPRTDTNVIAHITVKAFFSSLDGIYEAEDAALSSAYTVQDNNSGYFGTGFADPPPGAGHTIEWFVDAEAAGTYFLKLRYANGSSDRPQELSVNDVTLVSRLSFPGTGDWSIWSTVSVKVVLNEGLNRVRLITLSSSGPNMDRLELATPSEMEVSGNSSVIMNGDTTPDLADSTDFGAMNIVHGIVSRTFVITNSGGMDLNLNGTPFIAIIGENSNDFTVALDPVTPIARGSSTVFMIEFDPAAIGLHGATVSIANDNAANNSFTFDIQGMGTEKWLVDYDKANATNMTLRWASVQGQTYSILGSTNLPAGDWGVISSNVTATPPMNSITIDAAVEKSQFYKIEFNP